MAAIPAVAEDLPANIEDIAVPRTASNDRDYFYVKEIDGQSVNNILYKNGIFQKPRVARRDISAGQHVLTIAARRVYYLHDEDLLGDRHAVSGDVEFTPLSGHKYSVFGKIDDNHAAVWIQDLADGSVVSKKIESTP